MLEAARRREQPVDHLLFAGPPGLGKTSLAGIVAAEMGVGLRITSGPALVRTGDLAAMLTDLQHGDVLFIDEIHRLPRPVEEVLYPAMEDFQLDILIGKGPTARSIRLDLPRFTLVGATTRTGLLTGPLRDRFGFLGRLDLYAPDDLQGIVTRSAGHPRRRGGRRGARGRSPRGPGARRVSPTGSCGGSATSSRSGPRGPSRPSSPPRVWRCSASTSSGSTRSTGPSSTPCAVVSTAVRSGLVTLAQCVGEETETVEDAYEPYLLQQGLVHADAPGPGGHGPGLRPPGRCPIPGPSSRRRGRHSVVRSGRIAAWWRPVGRLPVPRPGGAWGKVERSEPAGDSTHHAHSLMPLSCLAGGVDVDDAKTTRALGVARLLFLVVIFGVVYMFFIRPRSQAAAPPARHAHGALRR